MRSPALLAALLLLAACQPNGGKGSDPGKPGAAPVQTAAVFCRPTPNGRRSTGCYLTLTAGADDRLTAVTSPLAGRIQIHESRMDGGMMVMRELKQGLPLPAGQAVALAPGGNHLMVLGLTRPLAVGDAVPLHLSFANAAGIDVTAAVAQPPASESHESH